MPHQAGGWAYYKNQAENPDYLEITKPQGRLVLAGDYLSFLPGWIEGAIRSAELAVKQITTPAGEWADTERYLSRQRLEPLPEIYPQIRLG